MGAKKLELELNSQKTYIQRYFPKAAEDLHHIALIEGPTPVDKLKNLGRYLSHNRLFIKRENKTQAVYGGNKVRNLEFILGDAIKNNKKHIITMAPYGSNFSAALAAQANRVGLKVHFSNFIVKTNAQLDRHYQFTKALGTDANNYKGMVRGSLLASLDIGVKYIEGFFGGEEPYYIHPGGSSMLGALGHVNAFLEFQDQVNCGKIPNMDYIVLGVGTCGTMAGLLAGKVISGSNTKIVGVRCVEPIVCNKKRIASLANQVLIRLGHNKRLKPSDISLLDLPNNRYAVPSNEALETMDLFADQERIILDTTYTSKVGVFLKNFLKQKFNGSTVLYWHTFCPQAM